MEKQRNTSNSEKMCIRRSGFALCPLCDKLVDLLSFESAADVFKTDLQDIEYLARSGSVHRLHNRKGKVMICSISLFDCFESRRTRLLDSHFVEDFAPKRKRDV